jgi:hypothetical protein
MISQTTERARRLKPRIQARKTREVPIELSTIFRSPAQPYVVVSSSDNVFSEARRPIPIRLDAILETALLQNQASKAIQATRPLVR